jgi:hypothetical protein
MNKIILNLTLITILAAFTIGCNNSKNQSNEVASEESQTENETNESNTVSKQNEDYFEFLADLNVGLTPGEIAEILPANVVKTDKSDKATNSDNFMYTVQGEDIEGFITFQKWDYEEFVWSFECILDLVFNPERGNEIFKDLMVKLSQKYGEPDSTDDKTYAMWDTEINGEPANVRISLVDIGIEFEITLITY